MMLRFQTIADMLQNRSSSPVSGIENPNLKRKFNHRLQLKVLEGLSKGLLAGINLDQVISMLYSQYSRKGDRPNRTEARVVEQWDHALFAGSTFTQAVDGWVDKRYMSLIAAGERGENLGEALKKIVEIAGIQRKLRSELSSALIMPTIVLIIVFCVSMAMGLVLVPMFQDFIPGSETPAILLIIQAYANFVWNNLWIVAAIPLAIFAAVKYGLPAYTGPGRVIIDKLPLFRLYRVFTGIAWLHSLGTILRANRGIDEALESTIETATPYLRDRLGRINDLMRGGERFPDALYLADTDFPDTEINDVLSIYFETGTMADSIPALADGWAEATKQSVDGLAKKANLLALILVASAVITILGSVFQLISMTQENVF